MEKNRLYIALGVVAALLVATFLAYRKPQEESTARVAAPWRAVEKAQITKVIIRRPGNEPAIELEKRDDKWFMTAPGRGPADEAAVNDALEALSEMKVDSVAAREAASHADLEVDEAHALRVQLFRGSAQGLDLFVGKNLDGGTAVRVPTAPTVYRVDRSIRFSLAKEPRELRDRQIARVERDHVRSVEWQNERGTFHFDRSGDTWTAAAANPRIDRLDLGKVNQLVVNLSDLRASDFALDNANHGITPQSPKVTFTLDNGPAVTLRVGNSPGEGEVFVQREGSDVVYVVGASHGEEIRFETERVQADAPTDGGTADAATNAPAPAAGGDGGIPPEVMEQIRRQLQQRGMQMPGG